MEKLIIVIALFALGWPLLADEKSDLATERAYREKRIQQLEEENKVLENQISELGGQVKEVSEATAGETNNSLTSLTAKALELEIDLLSKSAVLEKVKKAFIDKLPFEKGQKLESFTTTTGVVLKDPTVTELSADAVTLSHSSGIARLRVSDFPAELYPGLAQRPVGEDISNIAENTIRQRPSSVLKSAAYAKTRSEMARLRSSKILTEVPPAPVQKEAGNLSGVQKEQLEREAGRSQKLSDAIAQNKVIDTELVALQGRIEAQHLELTQLEIGFKKEMMTYDSMRIGRSADAWREEFEKRKQFSANYKLQQEKLKSSISELGKQSYDLMARRNRALDDERSTLSRDERKKKIADARMKVKEMETELSATYSELNKQEGQRTEILNAYDNSGIKGDRQTFESKIEKFNAEIIRLLYLVKAQEKKIRDLQNTIPSM